LGEQIGLHNWFDHFLGSVVFNAESHMTLETELMLMTVTTILIVIVIFIARHFYVSKNTLPAAEEATLPAFKKMVYNKYYVDEFYTAVFTKPFDALSSFLQKTFDNKLVDGIVNGFGKLTVGAGQTLRLLQTGNMGFYVMAIVTSLILIFLIFIAK
jgi:NADH-quinone oxidoreductase subunit L